MRPTLTFLFILCSLISFAQQPISNADKAIVITGVNVIPMDREILLNNQDVVVKDGKIVAMGEAGKVSIPSNATRIDGKGKYLMPGLAEMHAHMPPVNNLEPMKETARLFALHGITTIRGMLGHPFHLQLREQLNKGALLGPRFYTSGPSFNGNSVKSASQGEQMVRDQKQAGYDFLKLHPGLTPETFGAISKIANQIRIPFAGHVSYKVGVWRAIDAGYASIDHLDGFVESLVPGIENIPEEEAGLFGMFIGDKADESKIDKLTSALKEKNIWVVPTQALAERWMTPETTADVLANSPEMKYMTASQVQNWHQSKTSMQNHPKYNAEAVRRFIELRRKLILACERKGVGLLLGCDAPQVFNVPGPSTHQELEYMVKAGLTPFEAIKTGTANVGKFYKKENEAGVIRKGANSDLILLSANPLEKVSNTQLIEGIMLNKQWLSREYIATELKKLEKQ